MNRNKLKTYAPAARREFIQAVTDRANFWGLSEAGIEPMEESGDLAIIGGRPFPRAISAKRRKLEEWIRRESFPQVMEAIAYTWFNRFMALRYMEVNGFLEHGCRVLSNPGNSPVPEILDRAAEIPLPGLNNEKVIELKMDGGKDAELYRLLLVAQCKALHAAMPFLFERIDDETELLLPDNLLHSDSLIRKLVTEIDEEDWKEVEIIGWLYQFYISEKKDEVFEGLKKNRKITPENIPAATQLFTPHWIVRYLVENSLGRLWMLNHPDSRLIERMDYYIKPQQPETDFLRISSPEQLKICDPACGSGHMLVYAFDLLHAIYEEAGYEYSEIPGKILTHNLYGIEIDERAGELAAFALTMKARGQYRRFFQADIRPNICALRKITFEPNELKNYMDFVGRDLFTASLQATLRQFEEADNFGSLIRPEVTAVSGMLQILESKNVSGQLFLSVTHQKVLQALQQADYLSPKYQVVIANPPYMGSGGMNGRLAVWAKDNFPAGKSDLFAMFIERGLEMVPMQGYSAMVTMETWMFLSSYEILRARLLKKATLLSMVHMPYLGKGGTSMGINFGTAATIFYNSPHPETKGHFCCVRYYETDDNGVPVEFPPRNERLRCSSTADFEKIPRIPIVYWINATDFFEKRKIGDLFVSGGRNKTHDNEKYLRFFWEIDKNNNKWVSYTNGGEFRKYAGNELQVIDWSENARRFYESKGGLCNPKYWGKEGITWSLITSAISSFRIKRRQSQYSSGSPTIFNNTFICDNNALAFLNSPISRYYLDALNPTLNTTVNDVFALPYLDHNNISSVHNNTGLCINISTVDWDSFETSFDFVISPILQSPHLQSSVSTTYNRLRAYWRDKIREMQYLEEENNRIFIEAYELQDELKPEVPFKEITLTINPHYRYGGNKSVAELEALLLTDTMKELISYAIGCMMGRYSLGHPGLVYANSGNIGFDPAKYDQFPADDDGIVSVMDIQWFPDDAAARFEEFLRVAWSPETLEENLKFVAAALSPKGNETPRETIRHYISTQFFKDHLQTYKKRPIYWLFSSGKQRAFECLVYLHRYNESTLSRMRNEYVTPLQGKFAAQIDFLSNEIEASTSTAERNRLQKQLDTLKKKKDELASFDELLRYYADQRIALDLDEGVKVNYCKFGILLADFKAVTGAGE